MLKIVVRSDWASGGLRRSYVKTVGVQIVPVEFFIGAIGTLTFFTQLLHGLIDSRFTAAGVITLTGHLRSRSIMVIRARCQFGTSSNLPDSDGVGMF